MWHEHCFSGAQIMPFVASHASVRRFDAAVLALIVSLMVVVPRLHAQVVAVPSSTTPAPATQPSVSVPIRAYGILWAAVYGTQPVQSYGLPTANAPTSAINPAIYGNHDVEHPVLSMQVQQTRAGLVVGEGTAFKGTLEVDFIHFEQSSPVQQAFPRVRLALLEWKLTEQHKVFAGQTWDLFGNATGPQLLSHSFNLVGTLFQAGNVGFMRQQVGWMGRFGAWELASAAGMQGANTSAIYNNLEQSLAPTGAVRVMFHLPSNRGVVGASGIGTALRFNKGSAVEHRGAGGAQLFTDSTLGPLNLHGELYVAQNLANTGALNLSQGRFGKDLIDVGGYVSGKLTFGKHAVTAMYGAARVLNAEDLAPGYTPANASAAAVPNVGGPGMRYNMTGHVGYWFSPLKGLSLVLEPHVYATRFKLAQGDGGRFDSKNAAWGAMGGSMYQF
jgi:hypothetical protein